MKEHKDEGPFGPLIYLFIFLQYAWYIRHKMGSTLMPH